jgi:dTDP-4-amino-4,6-dideoxygalactose transaminase
MAKLALNGGKPVRPKSKKFPKWPMNEPSDVRLIAEVTKSNRWSYDGPVEFKFADAFAKYHGSKYGLCNANGTVAIQLALEALDIGAYDEVIVPGMTWQATAAAVIDVNAVPILVDVEPDTWCIDVDKAEAAITKRTKAIIIVHLYGCMPDIAKIRRLCKKHNLYLIEDCSHQHGAFWKGKGVGTFGDVSTFSFQESKVLSGGEGGFNMTQNKRLFERLYSLRNCGRGYKEDMTHAVQSGNYRITEWQAAMLLSGLGRLDKQVKLRDRNAQYLNSLIAQIPGVEPLRRRKEITQASYFNWVFRLNWNEIKGARKGLTSVHFAYALMKELNYQFEPPYEPLNKCELYKPHTKRRHKIDKEYWKQINPRRFKLPVCTDAHFKSGVSVHHPILLGTKKDMDDVATAVEKLITNIGSIEPFHIDVNVSVYTLFEA